MRSADTRQGAADRGEHRQLPELVRDRLKQRGYRSIGREQVIIIVRSLRSRGDGKRIEHRASQRVLTKDEARRIAVNIAKLPVLLQGS